MIDELVEAKIRERIEQAFCKSVYTGSIPVLASNKINGLRDFWALFDCKMVTCWKHPRPIFWISTLY